MTSEHSHPTTPTTGGLIASSAATHAKETATPGASGKLNTRISGVNSSALLQHFVRALWSEKTRTPAAPTLFGLGGVCGLSWSDSATLCCPSDCDPAALGLTIDGTACGCSLKLPTPTASMFGCKDVGRMLQRRQECKERTGNGNGFGLTLMQWVAVQTLLPTPTASDWKGSTGKGSRRGTLAEAAVASQANGATVYPHPEFVEAVMRFPISWTELRPSATASTPLLPSGSDAA